MIVSSFTRRSSSTQVTPRNFIPTWPHGMQDNGSPGELSSGESFQNMILATLLNIEYRPCHDPSYWYRIDARLGAPLIVWVFLGGYLKHVYFPQMVTQTTQEIILVRRFLWWRNASEFSSGWYIDKFLKDTVSLFRPTRRQHLDWGRRHSNLRENPTQDRPRDLPTLDVVRQRLTKWFGQSVFMVSIIWALNGLVRVWRT